MAEINYLAERVRLSCTYMTIRSLPAGDLRGDIGRSFVLCDDAYVGHLSIDLGNSFLSQSTKDQEGF